MYFVFKSKGGNLFGVPAGSWRDAEGKAPRATQGAERMGAVHPDIGAAIVAMGLVRDRAAFLRVRDALGAVRERLLAE